MDSLTDKKEHIEARIQAGLLHLKRARQQLSDSSAEMIKIMNENDSKIVPFDVCVVQNVNESLLADFHLIDNLLAEIQARD